MTLMAFNIHNIADRFEVDLCHKDIKDLADRLSEYYDELYRTDLDELKYDTLTIKKFVRFMCSFDEFTMDYEDHALIIRGDGHSYMIEGCVNGKPEDITGYQLFPTTG